MVPHIRRRVPLLATGTTILLTLLLAPPRGAPARAGEAHAQTVEDAQILSRLAVVKDVVTRGDLVVGTLVNRTGKRLVAVKLLVERSWVWEDEQHPGERSPGSSFYREIGVDLAPGAETPFSVRLEDPVDPPEAGHFTTRVSVVGTTEIG